ncbi:MAG: hypothetical protein V1758_07010, partial [Pseudomonadota bacterium]
NPGILMIGSPLQIILTFFFVTLGSMTMGVVFEGYLFARIRLWEKVLLTLCALCIFIPDPMTRGFGLALEAAFLLKQNLQARHIRGLHPRVAASGE